MRFGRAEIARARTLKAAGFPWRPRLGDWYVDPAGYCNVVRSLEECRDIHLNGHVFVPSWEDCREWLRTRGWGHPEVVVDAPECVRLSVMHRDGRVLRATGVSDLDCMYRIILKILLAEDV